MASQVQAVKALFEKHSIETVSAQIEEMNTEVEPESVIDPSKVEEPPKTEEEAVEPPEVEESPKTEEEAVEAPEVEEPPGKTEEEAVEPPEVEESPKTEEEAVEAPEVEESPKIEETSEIEEESPKVEETSETEEESPKIEETPETEEESPKVEETPETAVESPKVEETPETAVESPKVEETPETAVESPKVEETPNTEEESPKVEETPETEEGAETAVESPKVEETPETEEESPKVEETTETKEETPETEEESPKVEETPETAVEAPKRGPVEVDPTIKLNIFENAFDEEVCEKLKGIITKNMVDSTITTTVENFRKSKTSIIDINEPLIHIVNKKICDIIGADIVRGEPIQGIHYEEGGFFKPHTDYFEANELHLCGKSGNREMTAILYVDDVSEEQEGELVFPILTKRIKPRKGMLVFWNNMRGTSPLYTTLNEERPLKSGSKSCLIKYIREKPFF